MPPKGSLTRWIAHTTGRLTPVSAPAPRLATSTFQEAPRLLLVSHDAAFYGAQILALHMARQLKQRHGVQVTTVLLGDGPLRADFEACGPVVDFCTPAWRDAIPESVAKARQATLHELARSGLRHAICNTTAAAKLLPLLSQEGFKSIVLVHELPNMLKQFGLMDTAAAAGRLAERVVFPAAYVRNRFAEHVKLDEGHTLIRPQGLYLPNAHAEHRSAAKRELLQLLALKDDAHLVMAAGPGDRRKGLDTFCQVAVRVASRDPSIHFVWIGDDRTELALDCKEWLAAAGATQRVHFLGVIKEPDVYARRMAAMDQYLMTSREDPFPSVVLDAMTVGAPVVGFRDAGGFEELLDDGAGLLVPHGSHAEMAAAVLSLATDRARCQAIGFRGQEIIRSRFDFDDYLGDLLRLFDHV